MLILFSSDSSPRYKQNVLDYLCYPEGHSIKVRYQDKHVSPALLDKEFPRKSKDNTALLCYAESPTQDSNHRFNFCPMREALITRVSVEGTIYFVHAKLGACVNYGSSPEARAQKLQDLQSKIRSIDFHPLPKTGDITWSEANKIVAKSDGADFEGYFFLETEDRAICYDTAEDHPHQAWESVIEVLGGFRSHSHSIFFKILGFYTDRSKWLWGDSVEHKIETTTKSGNTWFPLPIGKIVTLKLFFYRSSDADQTIYPVSLAINLEKEAFSGVSDNSIIVSSRYNEENIRLVCKRVFDSVLAPISIGYDGDDASVLAPRPFLHSYIRVPRRVVAIIVGALIVSPFLLTSTPELFQWLGSSVGAPGWLNAHPELVTLLAKGVGALVAGIAGFVAFRKLPI